MSALERARTDLAAGRTWKARERLEGALANAPADQAILELLGEICFTMGDLPAAGAYWFLTGRDGADVATALAALHERFPTPRALFTALPIKAPPRDYPPAARVRIERLLLDAEPRRLWQKKLARLERPNKPESFASPNRFAGIAIALLASVIFFTGVITLAVLAIRALRALT